ncbi:MAG: DUF1588 domain-containing protein [Rhodospirillaceae bacterium]|nr:DUF1588 domain-containing protein [Rhodospirillaceae bacterium]
MIARIALLFALMLGLAACEQAEPVTDGGPATLRRLTESQYRNIIADVFGSHIVVAGRFDPLLRTEGLLTVGASRASITPSGVERYAAMARAIAAQVVAPGNRALAMPCAPADAKAADEACARTFYAKVGRHLYRRPLTDDEVSGFVKIAGAAASTRGDFYAGLSYGLQGMLQSPDFLFIAENTEPDPADTKRVRLDAFGKATRLSFLLWNSSPDDVLLTAAEKGELHSDEGIERQVERMMASPRMKTGVRAFFSDMLSLDDFATLEKDTLLYPAFGLATAIDAKEQVLRTLYDLLIVRNGDYRDLFTVRDTHMSAPLGLVYRVPAVNPGGWTPFTFPEGDPRAGIQTQLSFVALHSHPGKSSPTLRGKAIRELLLCQKIPDPPSTVNFDQFNDPNSPNKTARARLDAHSTDPACAGCHKLMDPIGLALENFDGAGQLRQTENGEPIDTSGELNGMPFKDGLGLAQALRADPAAPSCVVNRLYAYAVGRAVEKTERPLITYLEKSFEADEYRFPELVRRVATSRAFMSVAPPSVRAADAKNEETKS